MDDTYIRAGQVAFLKFISKKSQAPSREAEQSSLHGPEPSAAGRLVQGTKIQSKHLEISYTEISHKPEQSSVYGHEPRFALVQGSIWFMVENSYRK